MKTMSYTRKAATSLLVLSVVLCSTLLVDGNDTGFLRQQRRTEQSVICRITLEETLMGGELEDPSDKLESQEVTLCTPIVDDELLHMDTIVQLPTTLAERYRKEIVKGKLIVSISGATLSSSKQLDVGDSPQFEVVKGNSYDKHRGRHLMEPFGAKTISIVRISVQDSVQINSHAEIKQTVFQDPISVVKQMNACSHGKISFTLKDDNIIDINLPGTKASYNNDSYELLGAAMDALQTWSAQNGGIGIGDYADRTVFCFPEGFGSWAARAAMNHWRISVS